MERALSVATPASLVARALAFAIRAYRMIVSPILGPACRFEPSCSRYAETAIVRHGVLAGARLAIARVARCHPWNPGGYDPVR